MSDEKEERAPRLAAKLAEVMAAVTHIPKRGRNEFHKYDYATEADIVAAIRNELSSRRVMLIPAVLDATREAVGDKGSFLTTLRMSFTFQDGDSSEYITRFWFGFGSDKDDKGGYKAMTGGEKYFLLKTFLIPTGDDPEHDSDAKQQQRRSERRTREPNPVDRASQSPQSGSSSAIPSTGNPAVISDAQRQRMFAIASQRGWKTDEVKALVKRHGFDSSSQITKAAYDSICKALDEGVAAGQQAHDTPSEVTR